MPSSKTNFQLSLTVLELLESAQSEKLKGFRWADTVLELINPFLSMDNRLTLEMTGADALAALDRLPARIKEQLPTVRILAGTNEIIAPGQAVQSTTTDYERLQPPVSAPEPVATTSNKPTISTNSGIMILIALALVFVMVVMTVTTAWIAKQSGTAPNSGTLEVVVKVLGEVFKTAATSQSDSSNSDSSSDKQDTPPNPRPNSSPEPSDGPYYGPAN